MSMKPAASTPLPLTDALQEIVEGRNVKRSSHSLIWEGTDCTDEFVRILDEKGYHPVLVRDVSVAPGERVPAFHVANASALFGWIFWEKFSDRRMRKLFGSVVRNNKGDWAVQIPEKKSVLVYANTSELSEMDIDHPSAT
ncbi:MAG: hypothetical protein OEV30_03410 [Ignavibacteria bacterium]|nr:hypothetical protein [Ignavibacteria bacterium]